MPAECAWQRQSFEGDTCTHLRWPRCGGPKQSHPQAWDASGLRALKALRPRNDMS